MRHNLWIRPARKEDAEAISDLNTRAFGSPDEAEIVTQLTADEDSLLSLVAHDDSQILGHIQFFRVSVDGAETGAGLGPMSVEPDHQKTGIGGGLINLGLRAIEGQGREIVFVLGHPSYYPKFGFTASAAQQFSAPWNGEAFMAKRLIDTAPTSGTLVYPAAFGA